MGEIKLAIQNESFGTEPLTPDEAKLFQQQWNELFHPPWSLERRYINSKMDVVRRGVEAAKEALEEKRFGGFNCGSNELGISPIRPGHVGLVGGTYSKADNKWKWDDASTESGNGTGFEALVCSPETATTAFSVHEDSFIIPLYLVEEAANPKIQTVKLDIGRSDVLYYDISACRIKDATNGISLAPLPTTFWGPSVDVTMTVQTKAAGQVEARIGGFTVALGTFLDASTYDADTNTVSTETTAWTN